MGVSIKAIKVCTFYIGVKVWMSSFSWLFGFVGWEEVEFYIPPQPGDDDVEWALGCDYYGWE